VTFINIVTQNYQNIIILNPGNFKSNYIVDLENFNFLNKIIFSTFRKLSVDILFVRFLKIINLLSERFLKIASHYCRLNIIIY
jgi:hypothetical protein